MVQRMAGPRGLSATALSKECGVSQQTLSRWRRDASTLPAMGGGDDMDRGSSRPKQWTAEEKFRVVLAAAELPDSQLGEFLRREGVHTAQLEEWRQLVLAALATRKPSAKANPEARRIRELERDLDRKNKALAEVTALLALKKKAQELWGDEDEGTPPKSGT
jgi:transposase-like protein